MSYSNSSRIFTGTMKSTIVLALFLSVCAFVAHATPSDFAKLIENDLSAEDFEEMRPLLDSLDSLFADEAFHSDNDENEKLSVASDFIFKLLQEEAERRSIVNLESYVDSGSGIEVNKNLPSFDDLFSRVNFSDPILDDVKSELKDKLKGAQDSVDDLVDETNGVADEIQNHLKINKIKLVIIVHKIILKIFHVAIRASRAAYCVYSNVPLFTNALSNAGARAWNCTQHSSLALAKVLRNLEHSIDEIREGVNNTSTIVDKCTKHKSLLGKILFCMFNVGRAYDQIEVVVRTGKATIKQTKEDVPALLKDTSQCATSAFSNTVHELLTAVKTIKYCVSFSGV